MDMQLLSPKTQIDAFVILLQLQYGTMAKTNKEPQVP